MLLFVPELELWLELLHRHVGYELPFGLAPDLLEFYLPAHGVKGLALIAAPSELLYEIPPV